MFDLRDWAKFSIGWIQKLILTNLSINKGNKGWESFEIVPEWTESRRREWTRKDIPTKPTYKYFSMNFRKLVI
jgi:hypothetical protein